MNARRLTVAVGVVLALFALRCADGFRLDEMDCEEAMSHLVACCPGFSASKASCEYQSDGCEPSEIVAPVLTVSVSRCVMGESCDKLRSTGVCARSAHLPYVPESSSTPQPVCP